LQRVAYDAAAIVGPANGNNVTSSDQRLRIGVGIATVGRPELLRVVLDELALQTRRADRIAVCAPSEGDVVGASVSGDVSVIIGPRGLTRQRNAILREVEDCDIIVFFDDDFLPRSFYLSAVEEVFSRHSDVAILTGLVVADGIIGPGLSVEKARALLTEGSANDWPGNELRDVPNGYGCNMAIRLAAVRGGGCLFDEKLPLYGWLEDVDFSRQLARHGGRIVQARSAQGVHLGVKRGRQSGRRLGYSQIANPLYLLRKGTCPWTMALGLMCRNVIANGLRSFRPEPYVDRLGRLAGNARAVRDLLFGELDPERILEL
jgi:GT2 family glycosyltransferase